MTAFPKPAPREKRARQPLRRTWMRKKRPRRLSRAGSDPAYLAWVRGMSCMINNGRCEGRIHAHHAIHRSQGGKDRDAIPLCRHHHQQWHDACGVFENLSKLGRFAWSQRAIADTQAAHATRVPGEGE